MNSRAAIPSLVQCHPEQSLAMSEASRQAESKDPEQADSPTSRERHFRIVVRFFEEDDGEHMPVSSGEAGEAWESPASKCRGGKEK